jgi:5'-deoxynucleotidase YfbR-like HD superfamily hydrolase
VTGLNVGALLGGPVRRLSHVRRFAALRVARLENVAEHSYYVALMAMLIGRDLLTRGHEVDVGRCVDAALCHDLDEAVAGDLPRPFIAAVPGLRASMDAVNATFVRGIGAELGLDLEGEWVEQTAGSLEGGVVRLADLLDIVAYAAEEVRAGSEYARALAFELVGSGLIAKDWEDPLRTYVVAASTWLGDLLNGRRPIEGDTHLVKRLIRGGTNDES